jgi:two-component system response regulator MtrA
VLGVSQYCGGCVLFGAFGVKKPTVLFVDDDLDIQQAVGITLETAGFEVVFAENGLQALEKYRTIGIDLIILDVMMPVMNGLQVCKIIRQKSSIPILLLTAKGIEDDVVTGIEAGADDYVIKPLRPRELVARIQALMRRSNGHGQPHRKKLAYDNLTLDLDAHRVIYRDKSIPVSPLEYQLLKYLMQNPGTVFSKEDLLHNVWGYASSGSDMNMIEATVRRLRKKVETDPSNPKYIKTVWGSGYRLGD